MPPPTFWRRAVKPTDRERELEAVNALLLAELDRVRRDLLAPSNAPCAYCALPADRMNECRQGAGCQRSFDLAIGFMPAQPGDVPLQPGPTVREVVAENDRLRHMLAKTNAPCVYCGLPAERMNECASGFPGCGRADDLMIGEPSPQPPPAP